MHLDESIGTSAKFYYILWINHRGLHIYECENSVSLQYDLRKNCKKIKNKNYEVILFYFKVNEFLNEALGKRRINNKNEGIREKFIQAVKFEPTT